MWQVLCQVHNVNCLIYPHNNLCDTGAIIISNLQIKNTEVLIHLL